MRSLRGNILKTGGVTLILALLFCLLACPHNSLGADQDCHTCAAGLECQDLCDCHTPSHQHHCAMDSLHSHEFRDETASAIPFTFSPIALFHIDLLQEEPQPISHYSEIMFHSSSPSFAVRHLDTIILRV